MKSGNLIRIVLAVGIAAYALGLTDGPGGGDPAIPAAEEYTGYMSGVHSASRSMEEKDRYVMSAAFDTGSNMLGADKRDLVDNTNTAQDFVFAILSFSYNGVGQPIQKYPAVADAIQEELTKVYGDEIKKLEPSEKSRIVDVLKEIGKAVR